MSTPFLGEIRMFGFNFAPAGWQQCNGQTLPISQYAALFALLGTTYGGNGTSTFQLPNLQGQVPISQGTGGGGTYVMGQASGTPGVTLLTTQIPAHNHQTQIGVSNQAGNVLDPTNAVPAMINSGSVRTPATVFFGYNSGAATGQMAPSAVTTTGGSQPHNNMQPYLVVNFCIAMVGVFPTRG